MWVDGGTCKVQGLKILLIINCIDHSVFYHHFLVNSNGIALSCFIGYH